MVIVSNCARVKNLLATTVTVILTEHDSEKKLSEQTTVVARSKVASVKMKCRCNTNDNGTNSFCKCNDLN